jgi:DNA-binding transcriptional MocR family regulator
VATIQYVDRPGILDLGWGHPDPASLPTRLWAEATADALRRHGWMSLTYGAAAGPQPLVEWLCERLATTDAARPRRPDVFVTAGASHGLELVCGILADPGDVVLVDSPTYHLALRVLADRGVQLVPVPTDAEGILPDATEELIRDLRRAGRRVALLYLVPTFGNPTGASLPVRRRRALVDVADRTGTPIVEDDTYREMSYRDGAPDSLWSNATGGPVIRLGSFSKSVAPGLRLGWITADPAFVRRLADRGYVDSGGGVNHSVALAMASFGESGGYERHVRAIRTLYRDRRDALVAAVRAEVAGAEFAVPDGGWFLWVRLPDGVDAVRLLPHAERAGVSYLPGRLFYVDSGRGADRLRLSFSMLGADALAEAARRLGRAVSRPADPGRSRES